jgi:hypothetical protein
MIVATDKITPETRHSKLVHQYTSVNESLLFDAKLSVVKEPFVIQPNEFHVLVTDNRPIYRALVNMDDHPSPVKAILPSLVRAYNIHLKEQGMVLMVGGNTSLAMLLNSGCVEGAEVVMTKEQLGLMQAEPETPTSVNDDEPPILVIDLTD